MTELPRRPIVIWIAQIVLVIVGIPFTLVALFTLPRDAVYFAQAGISAQSALQFLLLIVLRLGFVALFFFAFWGLLKRRSYGRWMSVAAIGLFTIISIVGQIWRPSGPMEYWEYENETQRTAGVFTQVTIYGLIFFFLYRLAFSEKVSDFFLTNLDVDESPPPPPDTYLP